VSVPTILRIVQALLRSICEKEKFDGKKTREYLSFVQKHFRDSSILSTRLPTRQPTARQPMAAYEDFWWTLGPNRENSDEHMGMISIAVCTLRDCQEYLPDITYRCHIFILHLGGMCAAAAVCTSGRQPRQFAPMAKIQLTGCFCH
jgi:hypothetical protein